MTTQPMTLRGLQNVCRVSARLYSGAAPVGDAGFESLRTLGVRTIISVDGATPDVAAARRFGLRYVHLPFGYDGCPAPRALEIIRAVRDLPGPIYLHCHHGKHRSPAAAALVGIALDGMSNDEAVAFMRRARTDPAYVGLYGKAATFRRPSSGEIDRAANRFPETSPASPLVEVMVRIDTCYASLRKFAANGRPATKRDPASAPAPQALQLAELFRELQRTGDTDSRPVAFRSWLKAAGQRASEAERAFRASDLTRATAALDRVQATCRDCHARYRDVPHSG